MEYNFFRMAEGYQYFVVVWDLLIDEFGNSFYVG
jgi:hypothetical protein